MRILPAVLVMLALLTPGVGFAENPSECRYLNTQIAFFEARASKAGALDNDLWEDRMQEQIAGLKEQRSKRCPGYSPSEEAMRAFTDLMKIGAKGAATFFTMGAM
jgi:hypothetical protein